MKMKILKFTEIKEKEYENYIKEWDESKETIIPSASKRGEMDFVNLQLKWHEEMTDEMFEKGFVPSTLYFMVDKNERIIGAIHLRHELNDRLLKNGGHIGYGIRPSERKKGYATIMLEKFMEILKDQGYDKVLITCDDSNLGSAKTIENNGGELYDKPVFEGVVTRRYWVKI